MFRHLESLTWSFVADGKPIHAICVYCEPRETELGIVYAPRAAAESGTEGLACVDDVARAVILAARAYEQTGEQHTARLAHAWLTFIRYMQLEEGRFTNFVLDRAGHRNLTGRTSYPGGAWWTARAIWALATSYRILNDEEALQALNRCPMPPPEYPGELKTRAVLALAGVEVLRSRAAHDVRALWRRRVRRWCDAMVQAASDHPYVPDAPGAPVVGLWGYHQLHALAAAGVTLGEPKYLALAEQTVRGLIRPALAGNFCYAYPGERANQCAYCVSPMVQGLAELYRATGRPLYRALGLRAGEWFAGANDAGAVMYDADTGRCLDGLTGDRVSRNCGAESAIEAGFAELERRWLVAQSPRRRLATLVS